MINDLANRALAAVTRVMGEPVTVRHRGESATTRGVYQDGYVGLDPDTGVQVRSTQPVVLISRQALPFKLQQGDEAEVGGVVFKVRDAQPDGHDGLLVMLHRTTNR
jgi:hypothetical protein